MLRVTALYAALLAIAGCTTTSFAGLARTSYVDDVAAAAKTTDRDLKALEKQVAEMKTAADRMQALAAQLEQTQKTTAELQQLARQVEGRLGSLPKETLQMLVKSIEAYLAR